MTKIYEIKSQMLEAFYDRSVSLRALLEFIAYIEAILY